MKKSCQILIALLVIASMVLSGCGGGEASLSQAAQTLSPTEAPTEAPAETAAEAPAKAFDDAAGILGTISGNTYTSPYIGMGADFGEQWKLEGAEELQHQFDDAAAMLEDTEVGELLEQSPSIVDLQAQNMTSGDVVTISLTRMVNPWYTAETGEEEVMEHTLRMKDTLLEGYAAMGFENPTMESKDVTILGRTHPALAVTAQMSGIDVYMIQLFSYWLGDYGVTVTVTSIIKDNTQAVLDLFYPLD